MPEIRNTASGRSLQSIKFSRGSEERFEEAETALCFDLKMARQTKGFVSQPHCLVCFTRSSTGTGTQSKFTVERCSVYRWPSMLRP